jgi:hypothetical protein
MQLADAETAPDSGHVYRIEPRPVNQWMRLALVLTLVVPLLFAMILPYLAQLRSRGNTLQGLYCLLIMLTPLVALTVVYSQLLKQFRRQTYLRVTPAELEYYTPGLRIRTPWANIDKIDNGLAILREADLRDIQFWAWFWSVSAAERHRYDPAITQIIPLRLFGWSKSSPVVRDLQRYAPHLGQRWLNQVPYHEFLEK